MNKVTPDVIDITVQMAQRMHLSEEEIRHLRSGVILHDIGELGVPVEVVYKSGLLTDEERAQMMKHTLIAYNMVTSVANLRPAADIPYCHHERWDGTGYPRGLRGRQIPLSARIFAVVDVWDAIRTGRPHSPAWPEELASQYIQKASGTLFDPEVVKVFLEVLKQKMQLGP
jgi:HD-GYP domain-containing protein (c-di-GMP phosphodiesterase class II)